MKNLEYRAWDKKDNKMLSSSDLFKCGFYLCPANGTLNAYGTDSKGSNDGWGENENLIPLQLVMTFKRYENGINIFDKVFEGDIIKSPYKIIPNLVVIYLEGAGIFGLNDQYIDSGMCVKYLYELLNEGFELEVIGNIYENPELLK